MNEAELRQLLDAAARLLGPHLRRSPELRTVAALFGKWLAEQGAAPTGEPPAVGAPVPQQNSPADVPSGPAPAPPQALPLPPPPARPLAPPVPPPRVTAGIVPLRLGDRSV